MTILFGNRLPVCPLEPRLSSLDGGEQIADRVFRDGAAYRGLGGLTQEGLSPTQFFAGNNQQTLRDLLGDMPLEKPYEAEAALNMIID